jgi:hypothetical protein
MSIDENFWPLPEAALDISAEKQLTDGRARCVFVAVCDDEGRPTTTLYQGQTAHFFYEFEVQGNVAVPSGGLEFHDASGYIIHGKNTFQYGTPAPKRVRPGERLRYHHVLELDVFPGTYYFTVGFSSAEESAYLGYVEGPLSHQEFQAAVKEHCRAVNAGSFTITMAPQSKLRHHGAANLPGDCHVNVVEAPMPSDARSAADNASYPTVAHQSAENVAPTIFHITHWKAGSQWIYKILKDCVPDLLIPAEVREMQFKAKPIQVGKIYPTVYVTKQEYDRVQLPPNSRRFVVIRDLRDTLVSGYFSIKVSHPLIANRLEYWRGKLHEMSVSDGLIYLMEEWLPPSVAIQVSWLESGERLIRYESLLEHDLEILEPVLLEECGLPVSREQLQRAVSKNRFERLTHGRERGQENVKSHERKGIAGDWRNYFDDQVKDVFKARYGDLLIATGYERDSEW